MSDDEHARRLRDAQDNLERARTTILDSSPAYASIVEAEETIDEVVGEIEGEL